MDDDETVLFAVLAGLGGVAMLSLIFVGVGVALLLAWSMWDRPVAPVALAPIAIPSPATATAQPSPSPMALALPLVAAPQDTPTVVPSDTPTIAPTATPLPPDTRMPTATTLPTLPAPPVFQSGGLGQPRAWWEEHFGPQVEIYGMPGYGDFNVLFMPGGRAGHIERQFKPEISLDVAQAMAAALLPSDAQFVERYSPEGRPEAVVDVYLSASLAQSWPDASVWEYYPPGQFIVLYNVFEPGVARLIVGLGNNP